MSKLVAVRYFCGESFNLKERTLYLCGNAIKSNALVAHASRSIIKIQIRKKISKARRDYDAMLKLIRFLFHFTKCVCCKLTFSPCPHDSTGKEEIKEGAWEPYLKSVSTVFVSSSHVLYFLLHLPF